MAENAHFSTEEKDECSPNFVIFGEKGILEISNLDNDEISLFIEETGTYIRQKRQKLTSIYWNDGHSLNSLVR